MDTKTVQEKLQDAYHSMLDHIEELVDTDKTPLKEAFVSAEEKLSEWKELSKEEIEQVSDSLKENLSDIGVASNQLNESLKETLSFDTAYLATSVWNKLSSVADKTILELSELREGFRENTETDPSHYSEVEQQWFSDAMQWQGDYETALNQIDKIRANLRKKIRRTNAFSKTVINKEANKDEYKTLKEENSDTVHAINNLYYDLKKEGES